jgi:transposase
VEATSDSWRPAYYLLKDEVEVQRLNAAHLRNAPARKTDVTYSAWIARLVERDLARGELRTAAPVRRLRDLTRYRAALTGGADPREAADLERSGG